MARSTVTTAESETQSAMNQVQLAALGQVHEARKVSELTIRAVQEEALSHLQQAKHEVPTALASVKELSSRGPASRAVGCPRDAALDAGTGFCASAPSGTRP